MGRKHIYFCDDCKRVFGEDTHINMHAPIIKISFKNSKGEWEQNKVEFHCKERHFCGTPCLNHWFNECIDKTVNKHNPNKGAENEKGKKETKS